VKIIYVVGTMILMAACSTHTVRCRGLKAINKPVAAVAGHGKGAALVPVPSAQAAEPRP
jgi:hypothetical protein